MSFTGLRPLLIGLVVLLPACSDSPTGATVPETAVEELGGIQAVYESPGKFSALYYGNWCGGGWSGGATGSTPGNAPPIDRLDIACQTHDRAYITADASFKAKYEAERNRTAKNAICVSWRAAYVTANGGLATAAAGLPSAKDLLASLLAQRKPDAWGYDPRIFGPHPITYLQRSQFALSVRAANVLSLFKTPTCSPI